MIKVKLMNTVSATQLCKDEDILCPHCNASLLHRNQEVSRYDDEQFIATIKCLSCEQTFNIKVHKLNKPIVFLDQWFVSNLFKNKNEHAEKAKQIVNKLERLKFLQRVVIVASDIDASETAQFPEKYKQKRDDVWNKIINLSESEVLLPFELLKHQIDCALGLKSGMPKSIENAKSQWVLGLGQYGMRLLMTKKWMIDSRIQNSSSDLDTHFKLVCNSQAHLLSLQEVQNPQSALDVIKELYKKDFEDAILKTEIYQEHDTLEEGDPNFYQKFMDLIERSCQLSSPYYNLITRVSGYGTLSEIQNRLSNLKVIVNTDVTQISEHIEIEIFLSAERLLHFYQNRYGKPETKTSEENFNRTYGNSRVNDICRVATALPYATILLVDQDMERILNSEDMRFLREKHPQCQIFSLSSLERFERWLNHLLSHQETDNELRMTRRLLCGMSP
jgi:transcription elongation factor Elf1